MAILKKNPEYKLSVEAIGKGKRKRNTATEATAYLRPTGYHPAASKSPRRKIPNYY